ncbi:hypothetical protein L0Y83_16850 [Burkholderia multivorans]|nr:hypothetical protein [Burkholderia multivorans]MCO1426097.1 hypothetical protein [Burkholderia multivorans]
MTTSRINSESVIGVLRAGALTASQVAAELHTSTEVVQLSQHRHSPNARRNRERTEALSVLQRHSAGRWIPSLDGFMPKPHVRQQRASQEKSR